jgi:hypothetical protein
MKKSYLIIATLIMTLFFAACKKKEVVGPTGPKGNDGLLQDGFISGKINGKTSTGDTIIETFSYSYYNTVLESNFDRDSSGGYKFSNFNIRRRDLENNNDYFNISANNVYDTSAVPHRNDFIIDLHFEKDFGTGKILQFYTLDNTPKKVAENFYYNYSDSQFEITNYSFNAFTGALKFNYKMDLDYFENSSGNPATVTGSVDVNLKRLVY